MSVIRFTAIVSISKFRHKIAFYFKNIDKFSPLLILRNNKPVGYLLSPEKYEELVGQKVE